MPNEFIARNGIISRGNLIVSGSLVTTQPTTLSGSLSLAGDLNFQPGATRYVTISSPTSGDGNNLILQAGSGNVQGTGGNIYLYPGAGAGGPGPGRTYIGNQYGWDGLYVTGLLTVTEQGPNTGTAFTVNAGGQTAMRFDWDNINLVTSAVSSASRILRFTGASQYQVRGSGTTSSTTALLVQNANASSSLAVLDNGYVGIGTSSPARLLHLKAGSGATGAIRVDADNGNVANVLEVQTNGDWAFNTNSQETMRLSNASGGRVGIGTTSPSAKLDVSGSIRIRANYALNSDFSGGVTNIPILSVDSYDSVVLGSTYASTGLVVLTSGIRYDLKPTGLGINTAGPGASLHILGSGATSSTKSLLIQNANASSSLAVLDNGYVGIGTSSPTTQLEVFSGSAGGTIQVSNSTYSSYWTQGNSYNTTLAFSAQGRILWGNGASFNFVSTGDTTLYRIDNGTFVTNNNNAGFYAGRDGYLGFSTYSATSTFNAIGATFADNNTVSLKFFYKSGSVDTEGMRLTSAGRVGIGTSSPTGKFQVGDGSGTQFQVASSGASIYVGAPSGNYNMNITTDTIQTSNSGTTNTPLRLQPNGTGNIIIGSAGNNNVLIGTITDAGYKLDVNGTARFTSDIAVLNGSTYRFNIGNATSLGYTARVWSTNNSFTLDLNGNGSITHQQQLMFGIGNASDYAEALRINTAGRVGIGTTSPAYKLDVSGSTNITGNLTVTGSFNASSITSSGAIINGNLTVIGTASFTYTTASVVNIGGNLINLNTDNPAARFGGMTVTDSGSFGTSSTGSLLWDSQNNRWIYSNPSGSSYDGGLLISGPRNTSGLGSEEGTTLNALMKGQGGTTLLLREYLKFLVRWVLVYHLQMPV
jgi:hypothetical protein